jgi:hypothetical protein
LDQPLVMSNKPLPSSARRINSASSHVISFLALPAARSGIFSEHVGPNKRFTAVSEHSDFNAALDLHCREASRIIKEFSGGWYGKTLFQDGDISAPTRPANLRM